MAETHLRPERWFLPVFVKEGLQSPEPIASMPGHARHPISDLPGIARAAVDAGIGGLLVFGIPQRKTSDGRNAADRRGIVPQAIKALKDAAPALTVATDVCLCAYTEHGHCGVLFGDRLDHPLTCSMLAGIAVTHADAGADWVAPSSMVDGQVAAIRAELDHHSFDDTAILAYSAKFASAFYGPFREAAGSAPAFGDRAAYQHDPANPRHAMREMQADVEEGADILMIKPGMPYLDLLVLARQRFDLPLAAYQVSGEFAMLRAAAQNGWLDERKAVLESLLALHRAGADLVMTYYALEAARWVRD